MRVYAVMLHNHCEESFLVDIFSKKENAITAAEEKVEELLQKSKQRDGNFFEDFKYLEHANMWSGHLVSVYWKECFIKDMKMKYRVKFKCYHYNTGAADNHAYIRNEDFDTLEEAQIFRNRVEHQLLMEKESIAAQQVWEASEDYIEVENGYIMDDYPCRIVKFFPEREEDL